MFYNLDKLNSTTQELYIEDADFTLSGPTDYQWFGYEAICTRDHILVVGAPGERAESGEQAIGAIYGYNTADKS